MQKYILFGITVGQMILETIWDIQECSGQPTAMTIFPQNNASSLWQFFQNDYLYPYCGCDYIPLQMGCCISSIDLSQTEGMQSAAYVVEDVQIAIPDYWVAANNRYYCKYYATDSSQLDWGYFVRYLSPEGICYDGLICIENELQAYALKNCTGAKEVFPLSGNDQVFTSSTFGKSIAVSYSTFTGGETNTQWTTYIPMAILVPQFHVTMERIGLASYILAVGISVYASYVEFKRVLRNAKGSVFLFIAQLLWLVWVSLNIMDWTFQYPSVLAYQVTEAILSAQYSFSTLLATLTTFTLILDYYGISGRNREIRYAILIVIHLIFAGGGYLYFISYFDLTATTFTYWYYMFPIWNLLFFLLNTIPPILILVQIGKLYGYVHKSASKYEILVGLMSRSPEMAILMPVQMLNTVAYMVFLSVIQFTQLLQNDRNFIAWNGLISLSLIIHEVLNYWIKNFVHKLMQKINTENTKSSYMSKADDITLEKGH